jgi:hypothetical protein
VMARWPWRPGFSSPYRSATWSFALFTVAFIIIAIEKPEPAIWIGGAIVCGLIAILCLLTDYSQRKGKK